MPPPVGGRWWGHIDHYIWQAVRAIKRAAARGPSWPSVRPAQRIICFTEPPALLRSCCLLRATAPRSVKRIRRSIVRLRPHETQAQLSTLLAAVLLRVTAALPPLLVGAVAAAAAAASAAAAAVTNVYYMPVNVLAAFLCTGIGT